jgi:hypothetical protein
MHLSECVNYVNFIRNYINFFEVINSNFTQIFNF